MRKLATVTSLIGVLALAACGSSEEVSTEVEEPETEEAAPDGIEDEVDTETDEDDAGVDDGT